MAKKFKFDQIVLTVATVVSGKDIAAGTVITVNGDGAQILPPVASMLVNSGKAVEATEKNVDKIKAQMAAAKNAAKAKAKPTTDAQLLKAAEQAIKHVAVLNEQVGDLTEQVTALTERLAAFEGQFIEGTLEEAAAEAEEGSAAGN